MSSFTLAVPFEHIDEIVLVGPAENLEALQVADVRLLVLSERYGPIKKSNKIKTSFYIFTTITTFKR